MPVEIWLIAGFVLVIAEMIVPMLILCWFGVGAFVGAALSYFGCPVLIQFIVFIVVSITAVILSTKLLKPLLKHKETVTNINSMVGKKGIVISDISNIHKKGKVDVNGEIWTAVTESDSVIETNSKVEVLSVNGVKLTVKKI